MKRIFSSLIAVLIVLVISSDTLFGEVKLPAIFGDNMVLQQKTDAAIWGTAVNKGPLLRLLHHGTIKCIL